MILSVAGLGLNAFSQKTDETPESVFESFLDHLNVDLDSAIFFNEKLKKFATNDEGHFYYDLSSVYIQSKQIDGLQRNPFLPLISKNKKAKDRLIKLFDAAGGWHQTFLNIDSANYYFLQIIKYGEQLGDSTALANGYYRLGTFHSKFGDPSRAIENLILSRDISKKIKNKGMVFFSLQSIANHYFNSNDFENALINHKQLLEIDTKNKEDNDARTYLNLGSCYSELHEYDSALFYLKLALTYFEENEKEVDIALINFNIGALEYYKKNYATSLKYFLSLEYYYEKSDPHTHIDLLDAIAEVYGEMGDSQNAYKYLRKAYDLGAPLLNQDMVEKVAEMNTKYESEKKIQQIEALNIQNELQAKRQKLLIGIAFVTLLALIISIVFYINNKRKTKIISEEKKKSEELLLNILPSAVADELKLNGISKAKRFDEVTVLFSDIQNFTGKSEEMGSVDLVAELNYCFSGFDKILEKFQVEKIKTVGDAYICVGGIPTPYENSALETLNVAKEMQNFMLKYQNQRLKENKPYFEIRIGIHTGPVVAGIVGIKKFAYDIWGDTVNIAARMEQNCEVGRINISQTTQALVKDSFDFESRGLLTVKGKGEMEMFYLA